MLFIKRIFECEKKVCDCLIIQKLSEYFFFFLTRSLYSFQLFWYAVKQWFMRRNCHVESMDLFSIFTVCLCRICRIINVLFFILNFRIIFEYFLMLLQCSKFILVSFLLWWIEIRNLKLKYLFLISGKYFV